VNITALFATASGLKQNRFFERVEAKEKKVNKIE
jgi:hypothetical protein